MRHAESQTDARFTDRETLGTVAEYVCGLLDPIEHAQVHVLLGRDDQALAHALTWEAELLTLVDALPPAHPSPELRERLQRSLGIGPAPAPSSRQLLRRRSEEPDTDANSPKVNPRAATITQPDHMSRAGADTAERPKPSVAAGRTLSGKEQETPKSTQATSKLTSPRGKVTAASVSTGAVKTASGSPRADVHADATPPETPHASPSRVTSAAPPKSGAASPKASEDEARNNPSTGNRTPRERKLVRKLWFWRLIGISATAAAIVGFMLPGEPPPPPVQVVKVAPTRAAILQAPGSSSTPGWTATLDAQGNLIMQPLVQTEIPDGSQALLWTRSARIPEPRLLGRIDPNKPLQVPAERLGALAEDQLLEITLETDEDAANHAANGPILFIGQMAVFGAEGSVTAREGASTAAGSSANAAPGPGQNDSGPYNAGSATSGPITQ